MSFWALAFAVMAGVLVSAAPAADKASPPQDPTSQWLAAQEPIWQAAFQREVSEPFDKGLAELNQQYFARVEELFNQAARDGKLDDAVAWRAERDRVAAMGMWAPPNDDDVPALVQPLRAAYRKSFATLDRERLGRAVKVFARYDTILAQNLDALTRRKRIDEALAIKAKREELKAAWVPETKAVAPAPDAVPEKPKPEPAKMAATTPKPATPKPALAVATPKPKSDSAKRDLIKKLLAMGARVDAPGEIKAINQLPAKNIELRGVAFNPRPNRPWTDQEFAIIRELSDVPNFGIEVPITDAALEQLRNLRGIKEIRLQNLGSVTVKGFQAVGSMPELERMTLGSTPIDDASFRALLQGPKLNRLALSSFETLTDAGWASIATSNLDYLQCYVSPNVTAEGWAQLAETKKLREIQLNGKPPAGILAGVSKIGSLEVVSIGFEASAPLTDADLAPLGALPKLRVLNIGNIALTGAMFASWPERPELKVLWLTAESKLDDAGLAALLKALPNLDEFVVCFASITDAQIQAFVQHPAPRWLRLTKNTPDEVVKKLQTALPNRKIEKLQ